MLISGEQSFRRKRRVKSRIVNKSRSLGTNSEKSFSANSLAINSIMKSHLLKELQEKEVTEIPEDEEFSFEKDNNKDAKPQLQTRSISAPLHLMWSEEKVKEPPVECEYFTLAPELLHTPSCPPLESVKSNGTVNPFKLTRNWYEQLKKRSFRINSSKGKSSSSVYISAAEHSQVMSYTDLDFILECADQGMDIACTDEEDETLPPYYQIIPEMFYRFAGISEYSDSILKQSRQDFEQLLKCLGIESFLEEFLLWFPKPKLVKTGKGYISFDMFCDLFSCKFAQTILEVRWQYEALCSAILTMKYLDQQNTNRINFHQFSSLYRTLYGEHIKTRHIRKAYNKYANGIGLLTIVGIFKFCCDEEGSVDSLQDLLQ